MDITHALAPKSDQLDFADLDGLPPQIFTITSVSENGTELADQQPVNITLAEFPRVWRPSKGMLRVLADNWGKQVSVWIGRRVELYGEPEVYFGREKRGGTRISRLSDIPKANTTLVNPRGGKGAYWTVKPLPELTTEERIASLRAEWRTANPERQEQIKAEVEALSGGKKPDTEPTPEPQQTEPEGW